MKISAILLAAGCVLTSQAIYSATYFCETCEDKSIAAGERSKDAYTRHMNRNGSDDSGRGVNRGNNYYYQERGNNVNYNRNNNNDSYLLNPQNPNYYYNQGNDNSYYDQNTYTRPPSRAARSIMDTDVTPTQTDVHQGDHDLLDKIRETVEGNSYSDNFKDINITIANGTVSLTGHVNSDADRKYIIEKIRGISGIKQIINQIQIKSSSQSAATEPKKINSYIAYNSQSNHEDTLADQNLARRVNDAIKPSFFGTQFENITAVVSDGIVNIRGTVKSEDERQELLRKINNVPGVKAVNDQVKIN